jgi:hypothetical protein
MGIFKQHIGVAIMNKAMKIENFSDMQNRYQNLPVSRRASVVLSDAAPALSTAQEILDTLSGQPKIAKAIHNLRNNSLIISRIRNSEAKSVLMDSSVDFIKATSRKLKEWHKTLECIAQGKTQVTIIKEYLPEHLCLAVAGGSSYLALIKLIIPELTRLDNLNQALYNSMLADIRRCTTILSDCECASELNSAVLH